MTDSSLSEHLIVETAIPDNTRKVVFERDNYQCQVCGTTGDNRLQLHHWRNFKSAGGEDTDDNLVTVCYTDHRQIHLHFIDVVLHEIRGKWYTFVRRHHRGNSK